MRNFMTKLKNFVRDSSGASVAVEAIVIIPVVLWALAAMGVYFDVLRTNSTAEKASYTIGDMLSRETNAITNDYLNNTRTLYETLLGTGYSSTTEVDPESGEETVFVTANTETDFSSVRVSVITWHEDESTYVLNWSQTRGPQYGALSTGDLTDIALALPKMADQDTIILVETHMTYEPVLNVGLGDQEIETFTFTRPRYAPQLVYEAS